MIHLLKIDDKEMDTFLDIFFNGVTVPVTSQTNAEKRIVNKVTAMGQKYEDGIKVGVK